MLTLELDKRIETAAGERRLQVSLRVAPGERVAIYGATGAGKTTLLRMIAGLAPPDAGRIVCNGETWFDGAGVDRPTRHRHLGFAFQQAALLPHMSIADNLRFAQPRPDAAAVEAWLQRLELSGFGERLPQQLSGGQQQRAGLARALAREAPLWLLDEPLSAQDLPLRLRLRAMLDRLQRERGATMILVTHDLGEVFHLADRVVHLVDGEVRAIGAPREVLLPAQTLGRYALQGAVLTIDPVDVLVRVTVAIGSDVVSTLVGPELAAGLAPGRPVEVLLNGSSALLRVK